MKHFITTFVSSITFLVYFKFCISFKLYDYNFSRDGCTCNGKQRLCQQRAKKVVSDSPEVVDFAIGLVNPGLNLPKGQVMFLGNSNYRRTVINAAHQNFFWATLKTLGLLHTG